MQILLMLVAVLMFSWNAEVAIPESCDLSGPPFSPLWRLSTPGTRILRIKNMPGEKRPRMIHYMRFTACATGG